MTVRRFPLRSIGNHAARALADAEDGAVLAVFRRSLYVEVTDGRLVCIGGLSLGDGPLNARCALPEDLNFESEELSPGQSAWIRDSSLVLGSSFDFDFSGAENWEPAPLPGPVSPDMVNEGLDRLRRATATFSHDIGLGRLIATPDFRPDGEDLVLDRAAGAINSMTNWIGRLANDFADVAPPPEGEALIGLGPGLTPSGDDWIGGAMIALMALEHHDAARRIAAWVLPLAQTRTGKISIAHLAAAAGGAGAAALHDATNAICANDGLGLESALQKIDAIGHTSGWDALAGAVAALSTCSGSAG